MGSARLYSALNTKISKISSELLSDEDFKKLLEADTNKDQYDYLLKLGKIEGEYANEGVSQFENSLNDKMIRTEEKLKYYMNGRYKDFYNSLLEYYVVEDIKTLARVIVRREYTDRLNDNLIVLKDTKFSRISSSTTIQDFVDMLDEPYKSIVDRYKEENRHRILFFIEMNLDRNYYSNIIKMSQGLSKQDSKIVQDYYGEKIDLLNLEWIYRANKYYEINSEIIFNFTILGGKLFQLDDLKKIAYMDFDELMKFISESKYSFLVNTDNDIDLYMDRRIYRYLYFKAMDLLYTNKYNISKLIAIGELLEFEKFDIEKSVESKRFNLDFEKSKSYLIRRV